MCPQVMSQEEGTRRQKSKMLKVKPAFMDIFGVLAFAIVLSIGIYGVISGGVLPNWILIILIIIGGLGLIVDATIVISTYLVK